MCSVGAQQAAVLSRPVARHGSLGVTPERTVGVEVFLGLLLKIFKKQKHKFIRKINVLSHCVKPHISEINHK